jgi:hypothetical protein
MASCSARRGGSLSSDGHEATYGSSRADTSHNALSTAMASLDWLLHRTVSAVTYAPRQLVRGKPDRYPNGMGEHIEQGVQRPRKHPSKQTLEASGRRLLEIVVYRKSCRVGGTLTLDDLAETEIGDWKMPDFKTACAYAVSQGWLTVQDDTLTLTTAGLAAA